MLLYAGYAIAAVVIVALFMGGTSEYDLGYADGRAGEPMGWSHRDEAVKSFASGGGGNLNLSEDYQKGFLAGAEARKTAGGK